MDYALHLYDWLMTNGSPAIKYRTATELIIDISDQEKRKLADDLLKSDEVQRWVQLLGTGPIHHSKDSAFENCMGKLLELGLDIEMSDQLYAKLKQFESIFLSLGEHFEKRIIACFLARAKYMEWPPLQSFIAEHIERMVESFSRSNFSIELSETEKTRISPKYRDKSYFKAEFDPILGKWHLPWCYDVYCLAYGLCNTQKERGKIEYIIENVLNPKIQHTKAQYVWLEKKRYPFASGVAKMPGFDGIQHMRGERSTLVLYLEMMSNFNAARNSQWFRSSFQHLNSFVMEDGSFLLPREYLVEKPNSYYLYTGSHMGLGQKPRNVKTINMESTFRILKLKKDTETTS